jgi:hypothetical protein
MDVGSIAAISSGAVAVAAIVAGELRHRRSLGQARELADLDSVRGVLDEAAAALHEAEYALDDVRTTLMAYGLGFFEDEEREKPYRALRRDGKNLDRLLERMRIRLGRGHEAVAAFNAANVAVLEAFRVLKLVKLEGRPTRGDEAAERSVASFLVEQREKLDSERNGFDARRIEFIDAAQRAAGAKLPG